MTADTRASGPRHQTPAVCVTPDWLGVESCTLVAGHDGECKPQGPTPVCRHEGCFTSDGHWDGCMVDPLGEELDQL